jgi:hypothetical protein
MEPLILLEQDLEQLEFQTKNPNIMTNTTACDDQDSTHWEDRDKTYQP